MKTSVTAKALRVRDAAPSLKTLPTWRTPEDGSVAKPHRFASSNAGGDECTPTDASFTWITDESDGLLYLSPGFERTWGDFAAPGTLTLERWLERVAPEDQHRVRAWHQQLRDQRWPMPRIAYRVIGPDQRMRQVNELAVRVNAGDAQARIVKIIEDASSAPRSPGSVDRATKQRLLELERTNHDLKQFALVVSHDLKSPLRAIVRLADILESELGPQLPEKSKHLLDLIRERSLSGLSLVDGILDYSAACGNPLPEEEVALNPLLEELWRTIPSSSTVRLILPDGSPRISAVRVQLRQILQNLLENAAKHGRGRGSTVKVLAEESSDVWHVTIADDGPGIPADELDRVMKLFHRVPSTSTEGHGVGLAIVKQLVERRGGRVCIHSKMGHGTWVAFSWPKTPSSPSPTAATSAKAKTSPTECTSLVEATG